jgi:hypothetical protein
MIGENSFYRLYFFPNRFHLVFLRRLAEVEPDPRRPQQLEHVRKDVGSQPGTDSTKIYRREREIYIQVLITLKFEKLRSATGSIFLPW